MALLDDEWEIASDLSRQIGSGDSDLICVDCSEWLWIGVNRTMLAIRLLSIALDCDG